MINGEPLYFTAASASRWALSLGMVQETVWESREATAGRPGA